MKGLSSLDNKPIASNSDLNRLAAEVLKKYGIVPESIAVIQGGSIKTVWKVKAKGRLICLKRLKQSYDKVLFSAYAQKYIKEARGNVAALIPDKAGELVVQHEGELFAVYEWLDGRDLNFSNSSDIQAAIQGLARFHIASKGYKPPQDARVSSKLGKWPEQYGSMRNRMAEWKKVSGSKSGVAYHATYLKYVDSMLDLADNALNLLEKSSYQKLTQPESPAIVLCHQDFGKGNAVLGNNGVDVIDLDGVTFDLPARDLRKIIGKQAENKGAWEASTINSIVGWYGQVNPMSASEKEVLYIDLLFPHWYFGLVKNLFQNDKPLKPAEMEKIARLEQSKVSLLNGFLKKGV
ncbi:MAG: CotS family spore coat protein [Clostridia bacterium]|nr:CotS family spore coat protein [Clostridia bacterium]